MIVKALKRRYSIKVPVKTEEPTLSQNSWGSADTFFPEGRPSALRIRKEGSSWGGAANDD